jgi:hypothetical protein
MQDIIDAVITEVPPAVSRFYGVGWLQYIKVDFCLFISQVCWSDVLKAEEEDFDNKLHLP